MGPRMKGVHLNWRPSGPSSSRCCRSSEFGNNKERSGCTHVVCFDLYVCHVSCDVVVVVVENSERGSHVAL